MSNYFFEQEKKRQMSQWPTEQEVVDFNKKKTLRNFENKSATFGSFNLFEKSWDIWWVDNKLRQEFYNDTWKKYDFLWDTDESFNKFLVKKYWITSEEHKEATTDFLERWLLNTSKMLLWWARNISRAWSWIWQKIWTFLRDTDFVSGIRESNFWKDYLQPIAEKTKEYLPKWAETLSADFLNLWEWISDVAMSVWMPIWTTLFNIAGEQDQTKWVAQWFWELLQEWWEYVNKIPWLSHFRDSLSDRDKQRFDMFVWWWMFWLISWAKIRNAKWKLSFKALKNTDIIEAFLDIDRWEIPWWTVIWEVATWIKKWAKYLYWKSKQAVNYFDWKIKEKTNLVKETPKKENIPQKKTVSVEEQHQTSPKVENTPKKEDLTLKNYNKNNPWHKLFDEIKNDIKEKKTKNIDDWDYVLLKDWTFWEVMKTTDWKYQINTPDFYSKKKVERWTKTYDKLDIETAYKQEKINDSEIYNMMKNDEKISDELDIDFLDEFVSLKQNKEKSLIQQESIFWKTYKQKYKDFWLKDLYNQAKKLQNSFDNISDKNYKSKIKWELNYLNKVIKLKKAKETYTKNLWITDLISSYRKWEMSFWKLSKIFKDNLKSSIKSLFSWDTIHWTLDQIKKEDKAMANRLLRATSNKYNRTAKYLSLFDNFKKERRKNDWTILWNMYKKYIKWKNLKKEMLNWTVETYKKADEWIDVLNKEQRKVFDELHELKKKYWFNENYKKNYIPKVVKDYDWFLKFIWKDIEFSNILKEIIIEKEMILNRKLTEKEKAWLMNDFLNENLWKQRNKSVKISSALSRKIDAKTPEILQFYHNPSDAIDINIKSTLEWIEMLETLYWEKVNLKMDENWKVWDSILSYIDKKVMDWTYTFKEAQRMEKLLLRRFTEPSPTNFFTRNAWTYKNILINMNIWSITSAISNLKDFWTSAYKYWFINTIKYVTPSVIKKFQKYMDHYISLDEMWIDALSLDFQNNWNFQKFTNWVMTISWFKLLDRVWKEVSLNASYSKFRDWAKKWDSKRDVYIEWRKTEKIFKDMWFSKKEIIQIKKDFKDWKFTDDIKMALLHEITWIQPIDKNAIPPNYNWSITWKLFYTFKTFLVKKMSFYQKEFFDVNRAKNPKEWARRWVRLIRFWMMCMMFWMWTDEVKDMIMWRKTPISDQVFSNVLEFLMVSKYTFYMFKEQTDLGNYWRFLKQQNALEKKWQDTSKLKYQKQFTTMQNIRWIVKWWRSIAWMPLTPFLTPIDEYSSIISSKWSKKEYNFFKDSYNITHIPVLWKAYYFRKWQWATKQERKEKQRTHTPWFRNRTIREILSPNVDLEWNRKIVWKVVKVVDWDTIKIKLSPREKFYLTPFDRLVKWQRHPNITKDWYYTVRQQGIDTNESVKQWHFVEYFWKDASNYAKEQLLWKTVIVKADYMWDVVDTHNRLLWVVNTIDESAELLAQIPYLNNLIDYQDFHQKLIKLWYAKPIASFKFSEKELYYRLWQIAKEKKIWVWNKEAEERFYLEHWITKEDRKTVKNYQWKNN